MKREQTERKTVRGSGKKKTNRIRLALFGNEMLGTLTCHKTALESALLVTN